MPLKCMLGLHKGKWSYSRQDSCEQYKICDDCSKRSERIAHEAWSDWDFTQSGNCNKERICTRCHETQEKVEHSWSNWYYKQEGECTVVRICERCEQSEEKYGLTTHTFGPEKYYMFPGQCIVVMVCKRCNRQMPIGNEHDWGHWFPNPNQRHQLVRICRRCNNRETSSI